MFRGIIYLLKFCWKSKKSYLIYLASNQLIVALQTLLVIIMPKFIIDELLATQRTDYLLIYVFVLVGGALICQLLSSFFQTQSFLKKSLIFNDFEIMLGRKLAMADYGNLENPAFLDTKEKAYKFLYGDGQGFATVIDDFFGIIGKFITFIGIIAIIFTLNIFILILFIALVLVNSYFDSKNKKANVKLDMEKAPYERKNMYLSNILDDFSYGKEMRIGKIQEWIIERYKKHIGKTHAFYEKSIRNSRKSLYFSAGVTFIQSIFTYGYLISQTISGHIGIGSFTMFVSAVNSFNNSMQDVMYSFINIAKYSQYYKAVEEYINIPTTIRDSGNIKLDKNEKSYHIVFENVWFKYKGQTDYVIKDLNLTIESGKKYSIVGENGAGKTTMVKLLIRLYDPCKGKILLNGVDIRDIDYDHYISIFSAVFQDYKLFSFSLKENIILKDAELEKDEDVVRLLKTTNFSDKLDSLPLGVNTAVYKNFDIQGFEPSGGEAQKIVLARALYKDASIIILDEPASALDPRAEFQLYQQFNNLVQNKTAIYISHRLSSSRFCDDIIVFKNGCVVEQGNHDKLIKHDGLYKELYDMQAQFYVKNNN